MKLELVVKTRVHQGLRFSTDEPGVYNIGRAGDVDLTLPKDKAVAGKHCEIEFTEDGAWVRDQLSRNSTFVNGQQIQEAQLADGDTLLVGQSAISISLSGVSPPTATIERPIGVPGFTLVKKLPFSGDQEIYWALPKGQPNLVILHFASIRAAPGMNNKEVNRLLKQAAITNRLQGQPGILPVRGQGLAGDVMWFTTGFVDGEGLDQYVARSKGLPYQEAVEIVGQAADILGYMHESGVVHRSLCPDSLWVSQCGKTLTIYLVGLDSATWRQIRDIHSNTTVGRYGYRISPFTAPEALINNTTMDKRSDIYALGAILYFTLTGQSPYVVSEGQDLVMTIRLEEPPSLSALKPNLPKAIVKVVERAMARDVDDRYNTVEEMRRALVGDRDPMKIRMPLIKALVSVPATSTSGGRTALLAGLPPGVVAGLNRSDDNSMVDLTNIVTQLNALGCLNTGEWPLLVVIDNALQHVQGTQVGQELETLKKTLVDLY
jgi:serine/threonine protein kinase